MPLELATYIDDFVTSNPAASDSMAYADDHIRLIKGVLKSTFPGLSAPLTRSGGLIVPTGAASAPSYAFADEPTLGFHRSSSGLILITGGRLDGNGAVPVGSLHQFLNEPAKLGKGGTVPSGGAEYLELDGSTYNTADFPRLASHMGITAPTFTLINVTDTGRFPRSRRIGVAAGAKEAGLVGAHTHAATADGAGAHSHTLSGTTGGMNANNPHSHSNQVFQYGPFAGGGGGNVLQATGQSNGAGFLRPPGTENADIQHGHDFSGTTSTSAPHSHNITVAANVGAENRPEAFSVIMAIKT